MAFLSWVRHQTSVVRGIASTSPSIRALGVSVIPRMERLMVVHPLVGGRSNEGFAAAHWRQVVLELEKQGRLHLLTANVYLAVNDL